MKKCKEGNVVANHVFPISSVGMSYFVYFVFPVVAVPPSLPLPLIWKRIPLSLSCQRGNIAVSFTVDNAKSVAP
jgi:hypothetical protein